MIYSNSNYRDVERMSAEIIELKDRIQDYQEEIHSLKTELKRRQTSGDRLRDSYESKLAEKDAIIRELTNKLAYMAAVAGRDGTNTGLPTSHTPINKKKVVPNSREKTGKKKGGQPGHERHTMSGGIDADDTETVTHGFDTGTEYCPACGGDLIDTGREIPKDEYDVRITVVRRCHMYKIYECVNCGKEIRQPIEKRLKEKCQYGNNVQALSLSLMSTGNVAINKVRMLISGMTGGRMAPSEAFICKIYQRAARALEPFVSGLRRVLISRPLIYWDDTVIMIQTKRGCMRFYGDEKISYYTAHRHKDMGGLLEDDILTVLTPEATVMHDHNKVNYNDRFRFENIECNQHLERDLQRTADENPKHTWAVEMKAYISATIRKRDSLIAKGKNSFSAKETEKFWEKVTGLLERGMEENKKTKDRYAGPFESVLLKRIDEYRDNYFRWVTDFSLPTTDNLSERGLRCIKSHMKISGQFDNEKTAGYYAIVKTYVETCRKNGLNEMMALSKLCAGNPYTIEEVFA